MLVAATARATPGAAIGLGEMLGGAALFSLYVAADQIALLTPGRG